MFSILVANHNTIGKYGIQLYHCLNNFPHICRAQIHRCGMNPGFKIAMLMKKNLSA